MAIKILLIVSVKNGITTIGILSKIPMIFTMTLIKIFLDKLIKKSIFLVKLMWGFVGKGVMICQCSLANTIIRLTTRIG